MSILDDAKWLKEQKVAPLDVSFADMFNPANFTEGLKKIQQWEAEYHASLKGEL